MNKPGTPPSYTTMYINIWLYIDPRTNVKVNSSISPILLFCDYRVYLSRLQSDKYYLLDYQTASIFPSKWSNITTYTATRISWSWSRKLAVRISMSCLPAQRRMESVGVPTALKVNSTPLSSVCDIYVTFLPAEPFIELAVKSAPSDSHFIVVEVGGRSL